MKIDEKVTNVYRTNDLSQFKLMLGNRDVTEARVKKIKESIQKNGYLHSPILVNERNEVIDGQGRLAACKELKCAIEYIVVPGFTIEECRVLNMMNKNWTLADYIDSYAGSGNINYLRMKNLLKIYNKVFTAGFAATLYGATKVQDSQALRDGKITISEATYSSAANALEWARDAMSIISTQAKGKGIECALIVIYANPVCNNEHMKAQLQKYIHSFPEVTTIDGALKALSHIYNIRSRQPKVFFDTDYAKLKETMSAFD